MGANFMASLAALEEVNPDRCPAGPAVDESPARMSTYRYARRVLLRRNRTFRIVSFMRVRVVSFMRFRRCLLVICLKTRGRRLDLLFDHLGGGGGSVANDDDDDDDDDDVNADVRRRRHREYCILRRCSVISMTIL